MDLILLRTPEGIDWQEMKRVLVEDDFDNGRTPEQLERSFANSHSFCVAYSGGRMIGTARVLSDGVCNAYVVDVWTHSDFRRQAVATRMMEALLHELPGQHVYLFTDDAVDFYTTLGFRPQGTGLARVIGRWLDNTPL